MYAIVEILGKHYKAEKGKEIVVDLLHLEEGKKASFDKVLVLRDDKDIKIGTPYLAGVTVEAKVVAPYAMGKKLTVFKFQRKTAYRVKNGHRQKYSVIEVTGIKTGTSKKTEEKPVEA